MNIIQFPTRELWPELCTRPSLDVRVLNKTVQAIIDEVQNNGDQALKRYTSEFDGVLIDTILTSTDEITTASKTIDSGLAQAMQVAAQNISTFHKAQQQETLFVNTSIGVQCRRKNVAIEKVGLYIPGGSAPLFSTLLMLAVPAQIVGCTEIILCTPPNKNGEIHPAILYAAEITGVTKIFKVGGAQAIAAMACGTESIPKVDKIFGPGNQYVTCAKILVQQNGVAIDMPAGPSELLVIADDTCVPAFVAADLLSQAEHGADSQVVLLSNSETVLQQCIDEIKQQIAHLPRVSTAEKALINSHFILLSSLDEAIDFSNQYAPEHLILACMNDEMMAEKVINAGSVFLGNFSPESAGDYASGTNHTLPTSGHARAYSGVSTDSFVKKITFQKLTQQGLQQLASTIETMAEAEGLIAHKNAVSIRLKKSTNE